MRGIRILAASTFDQASPRCADVLAPEAVGSCGPVHSSSRSLLEREQQAGTGVVIRVVCDQTIRVVHLAGELDVAGRAEVTRACCEATGVEVRVDLADLTFMDCGGYRGITEARSALEARGGSLTLSHASGEPARLLGLLDVEVPPCRCRTVNRSQRDGAGRPNSATVAWAQRRRRLLARSPSDEGGP